jgi:hypothetical protein
LAQLQNRKAGIDHIEKKATSDASTSKKSHAFTTPVSLARMEMVFGRISEEVRSKIT